MIIISFPVLAFTNTKSVIGDVCVLRELEEEEEAEVEVDVYTLATGAVAGTTASFEANEAALLLLTPMVEYKASRKEPLASTQCDSNTAAISTFDVNRMIVDLIHKQGR